MNKIYIVIITVFIFKANAASLIRVDKSVIEEVIPFSHKYELIIGENCLYCLDQLAVLKECADERDVIVLIDNRNKLSEERLKKIVKKKKIPFRTYILEDVLKQTYNFKSITPMIWINKPEGKRSFTGIVSCQELKS